MLEFDANVEQPPSSPHIFRVTLEASYTSNIPDMVTRLLLSLTPELTSIPMISGRGVKKKAKLARESREDTGVASSSSCLRW